MMTINAHESRARAGGWVLKEFAAGVFKWWHPKRDDGARYTNTESSLKHLCEDYEL